LVLSETLRSDVAFIPLNDRYLSKGLYVYRISGDTVKTEFSNKIIIE